MEYEEFIRLTNKWGDDPKSISKEESKSIQNYARDNDPNSNFTVEDDLSQEAIDAIGLFLTSQELKDIAKKDRTDAQYEFALQDLSESAKNWNEIKGQRILERNEEIKNRDSLKTDIQNKKADAYYASQAGVDAFKTIESFRQIRKGQKEGDRLAGARPQAPGIQDSTDLRNASQKAQARAQRGLTDRALGAIATQDNLDYANQKNAVTSASAGQAGVYGGLMAKGNVDVLKRNLLIGQAEQAAQAQNESVSAGLAQARAQEQANNQRLNIETNYMPRLEEWRRSSAEARETERSGRLNLARTMQIMPYRASNIANEYYRRPERTGEVPIDPRVKAQRTENIESVVDNKMKKDKDSAQARKGFSDWLSKYNDAMKGVYKNVSDDALKYKPNSKSNLDDNDVPDF